MIVVRHDIPNVEVEDAPEEFQTQVEPEPQKGYAEGNLHVKPLAPNVNRLILQLGYWRWS